MAADTKKVILIILYSIIALGIIVALALLLRIPPKKPQVSTVAIQAPVTEPPKNVQEALSGNSETVPKPDESGTVITIVYNNQDVSPTHDTAAQPAEKPATSVPVPATPTASKSSAVTSSRTTSDTSSSTGSAQPSTQVTKPTSSQTAQAKQTHYWIQVASFSTKIKAEDMQRKLTEKSLTSYLISSTVNGKTWYRVRIGPYPSKADAERWLTTIKKLPDCSDAFIIIQQ